jgi:hypothetical protein
MDSYGNFVIAWQDNRNGMSNIYFQRYNSFGEAIDINTKVNYSPISPFQTSPSISIDSLGNFVITWQDPRSSNWDIYCQRFSSSGSERGSNTKVSDDARGFNQLDPSISMDSQGNFVILWEDYRYNVNHPDIIGQRYYVDGSPNGSNYRVVADGLNHNKSHPVVSANNSLVVFVWMDNRRLMEWDIYAKIVSWDWDGVTSVSELGDNLPKDFSLSQNYPNPFNPSTKIKYAISSPQYATLKVYDILGNEVASLVNEYKSPGTYEVDFPTVGMRHASSTTNVLPSGVYFYQLKAGDFMQTKKMLLLR